MYVVVAYDVADDRRRARLAKRLLDYVPRVQESVFEGEIPERRLPGLRRVLLDTLDLAEDAVRVYHLCSACRHRVEGMGVTSASTVGGGGAVDEIFDI